jgi:hypothetical protein
LNILIAITIYLLIVIASLLMAACFLSISVLLVARKRLLNYISLKDWDREQKDNGYEE